MRSVCIGIAVIVATIASDSFALTQTLYINRGTFVTIKETSFPALSINTTPQYSPQSAVIEASPTESIDLTVINTDTTSHGFSIRGSVMNAVVIPPGAAATIHTSFTTEGVYLYEDSLLSGSYSYLGSSGMIVVSSKRQQLYFWNIREYQSSLNQNVARGALLDTRRYDPDFFLINGRSYPDIQSDSTAAIHGSLGDTIRVCIANTGSSMHSIHFHGVHLRCVFSNSAPIRTGWVKDTWALRSKQTVILELVVDKVGRYSVHDHNLVAVSAAKTHPNGMFTIMEFK